MLCRRCGDRSVDDGVDVVHPPAVGRQRSRRIRLGRLGHDVSRSEQEARDAHSQEKRDGS